jgi:hypothetical protein
MLVHDLVSIITWNTINQSILLLNLTMSEHVVDTKSKHI